VKRPWPVLYQRYLHGIINGTAECFTGDEQMDAMAMLDAELADDEQAMKAIWAAELKKEMKAKKAG
jgi:hypothetical protein